MAPYRQTVVRLDRLLGDVEAMRRQAGDGRGRRYGQALEAVEAARQRLAQAHEALKTGPKAGWLKRRRLQRDVAQAEQVLKTAEATLARQNAFWASRPGQVLEAKLRTALEHRRTQAQTALEAQENGVLAEVRHSLTRLEAEVQRRAQARQAAQARRPSKHDRKPKPT